MEKIIKTEEFDNSFKGLKNIILKRKLYKKKPYYISTILITFINLTLYIFKADLIDLNYFNILKIYINTFLPAFITFCGFTMTAYSLVVGFLNYGVFKNTIETWYRNKIKNEDNKEDVPKYSLYQNGIALFALAILILLITVIFFLIIKFVIEINVIVNFNYTDTINAFLLFFATLLSNFSIILMIYNIVNIFTFSQSLNQLVYLEELKKIKIEDK